MKSKYRCRNCNHKLFWDVRDKCWRHKHPLHNDNCECRNPKPYGEPSILKVTSSNSG